MKLALKVTPGARRNEIVGWEDDYPQVGRVLRLRIAAPPVEGKANAEVVRYLSRLLGVPRSSISICHGAGGRVKLVDVPEEADLSALG